MEWISVEDRFPECEIMVLIFTRECLTTQAYFNANCKFCIPWGKEYLENKQPKHWQPLLDQPTKQGEP